MRGVLVVFGRQFSQEFSSFFGIESFQLFGNFFHRLRLRLFFDVAIFLICVVIVIVVVISIFIQLFVGCFLCFYLFFYLLRLFEWFLQCLDLF